MLFPIRSNSGDEGKPTRLVVPEDRPVRPNFQKPCLRRQAAGTKPHDDQPTREALEPPIEFLALGGKPFVGMRR